MSFELSEKKSNPVLDFLESVDPIELERKALNVHSFETPVGVAIISILKEMAGGSK